MRNPPGDEHPLIQAAQAGDLTAFEALLSRFERGVFSYLKRMVGRREDAEDITQETFLKVWRHLASYNPKYQFSTWLYTIATRTAYDWLRKKRGNTEFSLSSIEDELIETIPVLAPYNEVAEAFDLERAIQHIKPIARTILLLYYHHGFTYAEIANALTLPINTVKTHLSRAKKTLDGYLRP